jgi:hypothetical protein
MSKKLVTFFIVITIGLLIGIIILDGTNNKKNQISVDALINSKVPLYFYETTCPNCKVISDFMTQTEIEKKLTLEKIEVSTSANSKKLLAIAQKCNIQTSSLGVPLLYADGKCYEGRDEVIGYLSEKAGILETIVSQSSPTTNQ